MQLLILQQPSILLAHSSTIDFMFMKDLFTILIP
jgi:hypothetical protein